MILYLIIDLNDLNWQFLDKPHKILNDLVLLVNVFLKMDYLNQVYIICNKKIVFNTKQASLDHILKGFTTKKSELSQDLGYALCLANKIKQKSRIFVFSLHGIEQINQRKESKDITENNEFGTKNNTVEYKDDQNKQINASLDSLVNKDDKNIVKNIDNRNEQNVNLIKCAFVAEKLQIRIDALALFGDEKLKQTCYATGGMFCSDESEVKNFIFKIFCDSKIEVPYFDVKCFCHDREIMLGLVCPICLAIYCEFLPICKQCKTKISFDK